MTINKITFKIADIIIRIKSRFPMMAFSRKRGDWRYENFIYKEDKKPDILIDVEVIDKLPKIRKVENIFKTIHFEDNKENWRLGKWSDGYIYESYLDGKEQVAHINKDFSQVKLSFIKFKEKYALSKKERKAVQNTKGKIWNISNIVFDFLQVLLINYFASKRDGLFVHSVGLKDLGGSGLVFSGKSGSGKSTMARFWHKHSRAKVLNDDRIILRKERNGFLMHGSPWHGDFKDYLFSRIDSARLSKLFFIHHAQTNSVKRISKKEAFNLLYPNIFPTFWDRQRLKNIAACCDDLTKSVPCFTLGFKKNKNIIDFVRQLTKGGVNG